MELRQLRYFVSVAEHGGITRAARTLRLTQPALSRQLRDLEAELEVELLRRLPTGVRITPAGARLLGRARQLLALAEQAVAESRETASRIRLGHYGPLWLDYFSGALRRWQRQYRHLKLEPVEMTSRAMEAALREGDLDFALVGRLPAASFAHCAHRRVAEVRGVLALAATHARAKRRVLALADLSEDVWLGWNETDFPGRNEPLQRAAEAAGFTPRWAGQMDSAGSMLLRLAAGREVGVVLPMSRKLPHAGVVFSRLRGDPVRYELEVAWPKQHPQSRAFSVLARWMAEDGEEPDLKPCPAASSR